MLQQFLGIFGYLAQEWKYTLIFPHQIKGSLNHYLHISMYASVSAVRWLWEDKTRVSNSCYNPAWEAESTDVTVAASQLVTSQFFFFHFFFLKIFFFFFEMYLCSAECEMYMWALMFGILIYIYSHNIYQA